MDAEIKQKWLEDLESGKYTKGTGKLFNPEENSFCCLGVLGKTLNLDITGDGLGFKDDEDEDLEASAMYPSLLKAGLVSGDMSTLYRINDDKPSDNFKGVIEYIKKNL